MFHIAIDKEYLEKKLGLDPEDEPEYYKVVAMDAARELDYIIIIRPGDLTGVIIPSEHVTEVYGFFRFEPYNEPIKSEPGPHGDVRHPY